MCKIDSYYKFEFIQNLISNYHTLRPIEKIGNHVVFNWIFGEDNIKLFEFKDNGNIEDEQFIIVQRVDGKNLPFCSLDRKRYSAGHSKIGGQKLDLHTIPGFLGKGRFELSSEDAILFRIHAFKSEIEFFICNNGKPNIDDLYLKFKTGELNNEIDSFLNFWVNPKTHRIDNTQIIFEKQLTELLKGSNINPTPYNNSL